MEQTISPRGALRGELTVPGDKSISHRAVMFSALGRGTARITGFLDGADCNSTIDCFRALGVPIEKSGDTVIVHGQGLHGLRAPAGILDVGNSGTTLRLMTGILAAQPFSCQITGDSSIQKRPMNRVAVPLGQMGAHITGSGSSDKLLAPLTIRGQQLQGIDYTLPVASAQVKSAILLAGLFAQGQTRVVEPEATRDHTERMLSAMGAKLTRTGQTIAIDPAEELLAQDVAVPGDISSAAYFFVLAAARPGNQITVKNVGVNPTRTGILDVLTAMGADVQVENERLLCGEPVADVTVTGRELHGTVIGGALIPRLIDEIPVLAVAACLAQGETLIQNAEELKVKESNRIQTMVTELKKLGACLEETPDGMHIWGGTPLRGGLTESYGDHRVAMSMAVAGLLAQGPVTIAGAECAVVSFPRFYEQLARL